MILVTGGTGLVGSHLLYHLLLENDSVRAIHQKNSDLNAVKNVFQYYGAKGDELFNRIRWVEAELNDVPELEIAFEDVHQVYHAAALVSFLSRDYQKMRRINIEGTTNIVNLCICNQVEKLCFVSSVAAIENEASGVIMDESDNWNSATDKSGYAITKYGAEMEIWRACQEGLDVVIVNPGIIIGPGFWRFGSGSFFKRIFKGLKYYTTGTSGYVSVDDVVSIMTLLMAGSIKNERYIVIAENLSFQSFFAKIAKALNVEAPKKKASPLLLQIAWRIDWLRSIIKGKHRRLVRHSVNSIQSIRNYDNAKIKRDLNYEFNSVDSAISLTSQHFLSDL